MYSVMKSLEAKDRLELAAVCREVFRWPNRDHVRREYGRSVLLVPTSGCQR